MLHGSSKVMTLSCLFHPTHKDKSENVWYSCCLTLNIYLVIKIFGHILSTESIPIISHKMNSSVDCSSAPHLCLRLAAQHYQQPITHLNFRLNCLWFRCIMGNVGGMQVFDKEGKKNLFWDFFKNCLLTPTVTIGHFGGSFSDCWYTEVESRVRSQLERGVVSCFGRKNCSS